MHEFQFRGFSAVLVLALAVVTALAVLVALPASFMMVFWNATVFEAANGPQIDFVQGMLLWGFVAILLKVIFKPSIKLPFQLVQQTGKSGKPDALKSKKPEASEEPAATKETPAQLDNQQNQG